MAAVGIVDGRHQAIAVVAGAEHMAELVHDDAGQVAPPDAIADHLNNAAIATVHRDRKSLAPFALLGDRMAAVDLGDDPSP